MKTACPGVEQGAGFKSRHLVSRCLFLTRSTCLTNKETHVKRVIAAAVLLLVTSQAHAVLTVKQYEEMFRADRNATSIFVFGIGTGLVASDAYASDMWDREVFCAADNVSHTMNGFINILNTEIRLLRGSGMKIDDELVGNLLLEGLRRSYPCE